MGATELSQKIFVQILNMQRNCLPSTHVDLGDTLRALGVCQINRCRPDHPGPPIRRRICFEFRQYPTIGADFYMRKKNREKS